MQKSRAKTNGKEQEKMARCKGAGEDRCRLGTMGMAWQKADRGKVWIDHITELARKNNG